jgi:hypothetical protein
VVRLAVACGLAACGTRERRAAPAAPGLVDASPPPSPSLGGDAAPSFSAGDSGGPGAPSGPFTDFPSPIIDPSAPSNAPSLFGNPAADAPGGPCLLEPAINALYPRNWLRPRFTWTAVAGDDLYELRLHVANQTADLVVCTEETSFTMAQAVWDLLRTDSNDVPIVVSIRSVATGMAHAPTHAGTQGGIGIAPVEAPGAIVYWTTSGGSALKGFSIGDETVADVLVPSQVPNGPTCIGCHAGTPDGDFAAITVSGAGGAVAYFGDLVASVQAASMGAVPTYLSAAGLAAFADVEHGPSAFSPAHWATGDHVVVTGQSGALVTIDLEGTNVATASSVLARTGDTQGAVVPTWSHDGSSIVYTSTNGIADSRPSIGTADLYQVPYAARAGGNATPIAGASSALMNEYYPAFSPDDAWLAFDEAPPGSDMYNQPNAEVYVIPSGGGVATRLAANDPPSCSGQSSPGVTNSWPKWSPEALTADGRTFYFLVFSSTRASTHPQLYVTAVVTDGSGSPTTYGALYLWNQPADQSNHTPVWNDLDIPPSPPPMSTQ